MQDVHQYVSLHIIIMITLLFIHFQNFYNINFFLAETSRRSV